MPPNQTPDQIMADLRIAAQRISAGQPQEAVRICRRILERFTEEPKAFCALGIALAHLGQFDEAVIAYQTALRFKPDFFEAWTNLGSALARRQQFNEALAACTEAARLRPDIAEIQVNLSNASRETWNLDQAVSAAEYALKLRPTMAEAHLCLGAVRACQGKFDQAIESYRQVIRLRPDVPAAHLNLGLALLVTGNLPAGWPEYEWRQRCPGVLAPTRFPQPRWTGEPLNGKTILLQSEQGLGDAIHFIRYVPLVAARGGKVLVECPPPLARLFSTIPGIEQVITTGQSIPNFDCHIALPSLPSVFNTTLESIPASIPYLKPDEAAVQSWKDRINPKPGFRQIGLVWAGSPDNRNDRHRSIPLERFAPFFETERAQFHSLQIIPPPATPLPLSDWSKFLTDFAETAALIANLDLVISVDTAPAHLAAALGKPVWLLIPFPPDWRWLLNREDSVWYPTIRLFRQPVPGDWQTPIDAVAQALLQLQKS